MSDLWSGILVILLVVVFFWAIVQDAVYSGVYKALKDMEELRKLREGRK